jgi:Ran GTPase-activating protein 1
MVPFLSSAHATLKVLRLSNNGMGPEGGSVIASALIASAQAAQKAGSAPALERVVCGRNRLENGSAEAWAEAFSLHAASLREVRLYQNGIRMQGIAALAKGLAPCFQLQILDLQDNTATQLGSRAIAAHLPRWPALTELNLSDCLLRSKGARRLLSVLAAGSHASLAVLKLQSNEIDATAVEELVKGVKAGSLKALKTIELNGNRVSEEDAVVVALVAALADVNEVEDGLDELDDVEEVGSDEEAEESDEAGESSEDELGKLSFLAYLKALTRFDSQRRSARRAGRAEIKRQRGGGGRPGGGPVGRASHEVDPRPNHGMACNTQRKPMTFLVVL